MHETVPFIHLPTLCLLGLVLFPRDLLSSPQATGVVWQQWKAISACLAHCLPGAESREDAAENLFTWYLETHLETDFQLTGLHRK